jgi:hypothetical protein
MVPAISPLLSVLMTFCATTGMAAAAKPVPSATLMKSRLAMPSDRLVLASRLAASVEDHPCIALPD